MKKGRLVKTPQDEIGIIFNDQSMVNGKYRVYIVNSEDLSPKQEQDKEGNWKEKKRLIDPMSLKLKGYLN